MKLLKLGLFALATIASIACTATVNLPTPPPSEYVDGESSVCVQIDPNYGPLLNLTLAADFTPSNAVIVAFGTDADNDGDLSPEETNLRVGCDCGVVQVKVEGEQWRSGLLTASTEEPTHHCSPSDFAFVLKQPSDVSRRYDLAKVTTHNFTTTNLAVKLSRIGTTILVR